MNKFIYKSLLASAVLLSYPFITQAALKIGPEYVTDADFGAKCCGDGFTDACTPCTGDDCESDCSSDCCAENACSPCTICSCSECCGTDHDCDDCHACNCDKCCGNENSCDDCHTCTPPCPEGEERDCNGVCHDEDEEGGFWAKEGTPCP